MHCDGCSKQDYRLESRTFDHAATEEEARRKFAGYVAQKRATGVSSSIKGLTLFLLRVEDMVEISDRTGAPL